MSRDQRDSTRNRSSGIYRSFVSAEDGTTRDQGIPAMIHPSTQNLLGMEHSRISEVPLGMQMSGFAG